MADVYHCPGDEQTEPLNKRDLPEKITLSKQMWDQFLTANLEFTTFQLNSPQG